MKTFTGVMTVSFEIPAKDEVTAIDVLNYLAEKLRQKMPCAQVTELIVCNEEADTTIRIGNN